MASLPLIELASQNRGILGWTAFAVSKIVAYQVRHASGPEHQGIRLPRTISTQIELEDVDLAVILEKARKFGIEIPVPIVGRLSIKASATIPIGSLRDIKGYIFKGDATLKGASIDHVDVGQLSCYLGLVDGVSTCPIFGVNWSRGPREMPGIPPGRLLCLRSSAPCRPARFEADSERRSRLEVRRPATARRGASAPSANFSPRSCPILRRSPAS